jgi:DNA-binding response OmpR family regulator
MDVRLLRYSFDRNPDWQTEITVAENGEEAIDCLLSPDETKPDLVILDLNLPKRDGTEVLRVIRTESADPYVPVIVFSSSPEDIIRMKVTQANVAADCYVTKPVGLELFATLVGRFRNCYELALKRSLENRNQPH